MSYPVKNGQTSVVLRFKLLDSSSTVGAGLTGLTSGSASLIISTIADNEASATTYTQAGSTIESIAALGTFAAPTATKCRFKELDATNHKGVYEFQFADARFAVASAKSLLISVLGATNLAQADFVVPLVSDDPYVTKLTAGAIATGVWTDTTAGDFTTALSVGKSVMNGVSLGTGLTINAYTGNTVQTGDAFARIGLAGAGLTALGDARIANLDGTVTSRMASYTQPTGFLAATFPAGTIANTTNITAGTIATVTTVTGLTASNLDATVSSRLATVGYTAPDNADIALVKVQTDKLTFTTANEVDTNIHSVNDVPVTGTGAVGNEWGP